MNHLSSGATIFGLSLSCVKIFKTYISAGHDLLTKDHRLWKHGIYPRKFRMRMDNGKADLNYHQQLVSSPKSVCIPETAMNENNGERNDDTEHTKNHMHMPYPNPDIRNMYLGYRDCEAECSTSCPSWTCVWSKRPRHETKKLLFNGPKGSSLSSS